MARDNQDGSGRAGRGGAMLRVCVTCRWQGRDALPGGDVRPGQHLHDLVKARARPDQVERIHGIVCLTHCLNACNAVAMLDMLDRFAASETGVVAEADVPAAIPVARPLIPQGVGRGRPSS